MSAVSDRTFVCSSSQQACGVQGCVGRGVTSGITSDGAKLEVG